MDKCKWNFKVLNHYVRLTVENRFIILGYRGENWKGVSLILILHFVSKTKCTF